jgi:hypothetical protein
MLTDQLIQIWQDEPLEPTPHMHLQQASILLLSAHDFYLIQLAALGVYQELIHHISRATTI